MLALSRRSVLSLIWSIGVLFCLSTPSLAAELEIEILSPGDGIAVEKGMYAKDLCIHTLFNSNTIARAKNFNF